MTVSTLYSIHGDSSGSLIYTVKDNHLQLAREVEETESVAESESSNASDTSTYTNDHDTESSEVPNIISLIETTPLKKEPWVQTLVRWENPLFSLIPATVLILIAIKATWHRKKIPGRFQCFVELVVDSIDKFLCDFMGKDNGRRFLPYIGSLFLFILLCNLMAIIPFMKAPTASFRLTISLAICTLVYVHFIAVKELGILGYLHHLAGSPRGVVMWCFVWLLMPVHIIGEISRVFTPALRLFGNIFGEDTLIGITAMLGLMVVSTFGFEHPIAGIPLQFPFMVLAVLTGFIQAMVFSLLAAIYFLLVLPHAEEK
jgi:F-type H+-transporting ATPase subunit a